jgi:hypothetical protein
VKTKEKADALARSAAAELACSLVPFFVCVNRRFQQISAIIAFFVIFHPNPRQIRPKSGVFP